MSDEKPVSSEMARIERTDTQMALAMPDELGALLPGTQIYSPLLVAGQKGKFLMYRATNEECESIKNWLNREIRVINFLLHTVTPAKANEQGEITPWVRGVLVCDDGTLIDCGSKGVIKSLLGYHQFIRQAPWDDKPVVCTPVAQPLEDGKNWYYLKLAEGQLSIPVKKGKGT